MANHKSAEKRAKQTQTRRFNNKTKMTRARTYIKNLRKAIESGDKEKASTLLPQVQALLGKLAKTSAMRKNTASRKTSRLAQQVSKIQ